MKIFKNNLRRNSKTVLLKERLNDTGKIKYLPSFSKEWTNTIYSFNKNTLKNIPANSLNINKIIKGYFNLFFKKKNIRKSKFLLRRRRNFLRRIYISNAEIKHTNSKAVITLYTVNREKNVLKKKYLKIKSKLSNKLIAKRYFLLYKENIQKIYTILNNKYTGRKVMHGGKLNVSPGFINRIFINDIIRKRKFIKYKLQYLNNFIELKNLYLKKVWAIILRKYSRKYLFLLRKYDFRYSLNQYKFNKLVFLPILSNILNKIMSLRHKKVEYNIINLKSITYNTDLFTNALAIKLKKKRINYIKSMFSILNRANMPAINLIKERSLLPKDQKADLFINKHKDLKVISMVSEAVPSTSSVTSGNNFSQLLNKTYPVGVTPAMLSTGTGPVNNISGSKEIHNIIFNSIGYKNMGGIRLEIKGRLTKRYRADRSIYSLKWKGGLKNIDSSFKGLSSVLFRGNSNSNVTYSMAKSKRRIGAFAVKGWISGK